MMRAALLIALAGFPVLAGCGREPAADESKPVASAAQPPHTDTPDPKAVVSQFLDRVRRGGDQANAGALLTERAQQELERIGRSVQPIGSPDARFQVTRSESVPGDPGSALVHSVWSEPAADGKTQEYQVVWALELDPEQWRISGLALEFRPGVDPQIIDFENGELMAKLLNANEANQAAGGPAANGTEAAQQQPPAARSADSSAKAAASADRTPAVNR